jgi:hypothetical protein
MTRKATKSHQRRTPASQNEALKSNPLQRSHIFLNDPNVQEIKRALSPFWAWRVER